MRRLTGIYLVPDPGMLKPNFGPSEHIRVGMRELAKYFKMGQVILGENHFADPDRNGVQVKLRKPWAPKSKWIGIVRDLKRLVVNHAPFLNYLMKIKKLKPDFIYERSAYLNFNGLLIAKLLNIPHFYEVNWIHSMGIQQFYSSYFQPCSKWFEEKAYLHSDHCFFIGNQNQYLNLRKRNWSIVQNGIGEDLLRDQFQRTNRFEGKLALCLVANLMPHHRFDLLVDALSKIKRSDHLVLHLIGYHFENVVDDLPPHIKRVCHGTVKRSELPHLLQEFNVGLILGGPPYSSFMKLYEYAAAKLLVICPDLENLRNLFASDEIIFFKNEDAAGLAAKIDFVSDHLASLGGYGRRLYDRVKSEFTWEMIFKSVKDQINLSLGSGKEP